ncbi:TolC family outer membrane protein [Variovorax sp. KK3]|uniref:TolC family outer membrane protein n=1 Tax=Variovorax sp. KK3 TaxID=1855728 RepID=UPI00097BBEDF|nr:TolC family outer membrane protein [Variovorax sp. KK3]
MYHHKSIAGIGLTFLALFCSTAFAQGAPTPAAAAQQALQTNPEVAAKFNALRASVDEIDAARGAYLPRVDVAAEVGRTQDRIDNRNPADQSLSRNGASVTVTQMLWDGLATRSEVSRASHNRMARYFEFVDATEQTSLEAGRAFYDVLRYRKLVALAEDNYVQHKSVSDQIQSRVRAGVTRGVDLEQSSARLALAESNLITEKTNLHDVTERYRRVVGELPPRYVDGVPPLGRTLPASTQAALEAAVQKSPVIAGAIETLRGVRAQSGAWRSTFQPRVEARLRSGAGRNYDGLENQRRETSASLVMNWNVFNGGTDAARLRQQGHLLTQAGDLRDKACRDTRQNTAIAFNEVRRLEEQLVFLKLNTEAIEKARDAYRQQFNIGQRSLLDVLNAENELYTAKRALAQAQTDREIAILRTHAAIGTLGVAFGLAQQSDAKDLAPDSNGWEAGEDAAGRCPVDPTELDGLPRAELDNRVRAQQAAAARGLPASVSPRMMVGDAATR